MPSSSQRVLIAIDSDKAPAQHGETVFAGDEAVGTITSATWGYRVGRNLAMAYVKPEFAGVGTELSVLLIGEQASAAIVELCLYDAEHGVPRGVFV